MRVIFNLFLLIIVALVLSTIPLNTNAFQFDFEFPSRQTDPEPEETPDPLYTFVAPDNRYLEDPETLELTIQSNMDMSTFDPGALTIDGQSIQTRIIEEAMDRVRLSLDLSSLELTHPTDYAEVKVAHPQVQDELTLYLRKTFTAEPLSTATAEPDNRMIHTLYLPDRQLIGLIPVNFVIPETDSYIRTTLNALLAGAPEGLGLYEGAFVPRVGVARLANQTVSLYIDGQDATPFGQGSSAATTALGALSRTMNAIDYIGATHIFVNNGHSPEFFHDMDYEEPIEEQIGPFTYYLHASAGHLYYAPFETTARDVDGLFEALKTPPADRAFYMPFPDSVDLIGIDTMQAENTLLTLTLSEAFDRFDDRDAGILADQLVYTFTSLGAIDRVTVRTEETIYRENAAKPRFINLAGEQ